MTCTVPWWVPDHRRARGRTASRATSNGAKTAWEGADQRNALFAIAGVEVHLAAARLVRWGDHLVAEPGEQSNQGSADFGKQHVVEARAEQCDAQVR